MIAGQAAINERDDNCNNNLSVQLEQRLDLRDSTVRPISNDPVSLETNSTNSTNQPNLTADNNQNADTMEALVASLRAELAAKDAIISDLRSQLDKYQAVFLMGTGTTGGGAPKGKRTTRLLGISAEPLLGAALSPTGDASSPTQLLAQQPLPPMTPKDELTHQLLSSAFAANDFLKAVLQDREQVRQLADACTLARFPSGACVIAEGDTGSVLYIVESGTLRVSNEKGTVKRQLRRGALFGELALLYNCKRTASVHVEQSEIGEGATLWALERSAFQALMVASGLRRRRQLLTFLKNVPLFAQMRNSEELLGKIADACERREYSLGEYIVRQGARGDTFFVLAQGRVQVSEGFGPNERPIRQLERGAYFGEKALEDGECQRTANVVAIEQGVQCLVLDRDSFRQLIGTQMIEKHSRVGTTISEEQPDSHADRDKYAWLDFLEISHLHRIQTLGVGGFGRVDLVTIRDRPDEGSFALKVMKKRQIVETRQQQHILSEKEVMMACVDSLFVVRLWRTFKDSSRLYMFMEACLGGELWTLLRDRGHFDEASTRFYTGCVCAAFEYLHARNIVYRDLKPENMLLDARGYVKLTDFGFAKKLQGNGRKTWTFCGTPEYVAPEIILNRGHDLAADFWSLGVLLFELLTGSPPFTGPDPMHTYNVILKGIEAVEFPRLITRNAAALIRRLCRENPSERLGYATGNGIEDVRAHRWFDGFDWPGLSNRTVAAPYIPTIRSPTDTTNFDPYPDEENIDLTASGDQAFAELGGWDEDF